MHGIRLLADFEHTTLVDIVNTIRNNPEDFAEILEQRVQSSLLELPSRDEILMKLKVTMARIVAFDAFRNTIPHLDLILTPNGFGIVNNYNIAPASKERVERLIASLLSNRDDEIEEQRAKCQTCLSISES